jgi:hypothetical protein
VINTHKIVQKSNGTFFPHCVCPQFKPIKSRQALQSNEQDRKFAEYRSAATKKCGTLRIAWRRRDIQIRNRGTFSFNYFPGL